LTRIHFVPGIANVTRILSAIELGDAALIVYQRRA
jgi:hypothetical protein